MLDGRYLIECKIASGGTSTVYRGRDARLDRLVAVKVIDARYAGDEQFLSRFQLEARTIARLTVSAVLVGARASRLGPAPLITQPQAPAFRAASRTCRPPWIRPQR